MMISHFLRSCLNPSFCKYLSCIIISQHTSLGTGAVSKAKPNEKKNAARRALVRADALRENVPQCHLWSVTGGPDMVPSTSCDLQ